MLRMEDTFFVDGGYLIMMETVAYFSSRRPFSRNNRGFVSSDLGQCDHKKSKPCLLFYINISRINFA